MSKASWAQRRKKVNSSTVGGSSNMKRYEKGEWARGGGKLSAPEEAQRSNKGKVKN
jgi:hypothetical protein